MINERLKKLDEKHINQSWQPTVDDYKAIAPEEDKMNYSFNYARMVDGKIALITGASDGMGYKMAELYAQHGAKVIMVARRAEKLENAAKEIKEHFDYAEVYAYPADVTDMSYEETKALFKKAVEMGIDKIVLTHPLADSWGRFTDEQILELVDMGSYCEFVGGNMFPRLGSMDPADYVDMIHKVGAQRCILSSDAGQCMDPTPAESFRYFIAMMVQFGCTEEEVRIMCQDNPARLLGLQ